MLGLAGAGVVGVVLVDDDGRVKRLAKTSSNAEFLMTMNLS